MSEITALTTLATVVLILMLATLACGKDDGDDAGGKTGTPSTGPVGEIADSSAAGITAFLKAGTFREWTARQDAPIDSVAAHASKTRTYFNDTAAAAAKAAQNPLPKNTVIVKEIFAADGTTLRGQAVMAKVDDGAGGSTWVWFEGFLPDYADPYYGKGLDTCTGCHGSGTDFVRTAVPAT